MPVSFASSMCVLRSPPRSAVQRNGTPRRRTSVVRRNATRNGASIASASAAQSTRLVSISGPSPACEQYGQSSHRLLPRSVRLVVSPVPPGIAVPHCRSMLIAALGAALPSANAWQR